MLFLFRCCRRKNAQCIVQFLWTTSALASKLYRLFYGSFAKVVLHNKIILKLWKNHKYPENPLKHSSFLKINLKLNISILFVLYSILMWMQISFSKSNSFLNDLSALICKIHFSLKIHWFHDGFVEKKIPVR